LKTIPKLTIGKAKRVDLIMKKRNEGKPEPG